MKKSFYLLPASLLLAAMASCTNEALNEDIHAENYTKAFIKEFGLIDPNHTWGFTDFPQSRTIETNGNEWSKKWWYPQNVTQEEHDLVMAYVGHKVDEIKTVKLNQNDFHNFFVTHVGAGGKTYSIPAGEQNFNGGKKMNKLAIAQTADIRDNQAMEAWDHVNDFNAANNKDWAGHMLVLGITEEEAASMTDEEYAAAFALTGAYDFAYQNSLDSKFYNRYVIVAGADIDPSLANYHYLCFDYIVYNVRENAQTEFQVNWTDGDQERSEKFQLNDIYLNSDKGSEEKPWPSAEDLLATKNITLPEGVTPEITIARYINADVVESDNIYDDWVIRLTGNAKPKDGSAPPVYSQESGRWKRIVVEDLAATAQYDISVGSSDWDFNDVVFDAYVDETTGEATIILQALGGTLPVYLGDGKGHYTDELHGLMGYDTNVMINTNAPGGAKHESIEVPMTYKEDGVVKKMTFPTYDYRFIEIYVDLDGERKLMLAETGKAPAKIAVRTTDTWANERQHITTHWPAFSSWVQNQQFGNWTHNLGENPNNNNNNGD